jgi:hypothetical protein
MSALAPTMQAFFTERLQGQRQASPNTIAAYRDIDITVIALWLGHESTQTTQIYLHARSRPQGTRARTHRPTQHHPRTLPAPRPTARLPGIAVTMPSRSPLPTPAEQALERARRSRAAPVKATGAAQFRRKDKRQFPASTHPKRVSSRVEWSGPVPTLTCVRGAGRRVRERGRRGPGTWRPRPRHPLTVRKPVPAPRGTKNLHAVPG